MEAPYVHRFRRSLTSGSLMLCVIGVAGGLNLSILNLSAGADEEPSATAADAASDEPQVVQVVVDVPVPTPETAPELLAATETIAQPAATVLTLPTLPPTTAAPPATLPASAPAPSLPAPAPPTAASPAPTTASPAPTEAPTTEVPTTNGSQPTTTASTEYLSYVVSGVSTIVVAYHDGQELEFWSATPEPGWAFVVEKDTANNVEVKFRRVSGAEGEAKWELRRQDGQLVVKTER